MLLRDEVAALFRVRPRTIDAFVASGRLRATKVGGRLNRFLVRDVERFLGVPAGTLQLRSNGATADVDQQPARVKPSAPRRARGGNGEAGP